MSQSGDLTARIGLLHPVIQGPFGSGFSTPALTAAVSNAGGLGSFGAHMLDQQSILNTAAAIRGLTSRPFALNLWVSNHDPGGDSPDAGAMERMVDRMRHLFLELGLEPKAPAPKIIRNFDDQARAVIEARPAVFSFIFGIPAPEILRECRNRGILTSGGATTVGEARALADAGVDIVVASGLEAGGHRASFLASAEDSLTGTMSLVPQVASAVDRPVVAAGGIADARGVAAALRLGARAAQVGTAFLACEESGAPELHRALLFEPEARRTVLSRAYTGRLARGIRNRIHDDLAGGGFLPYPAQGWMVTALREAAIEQRRADLLALWCGQSAGLIRHRRAQDLMAALTASSD
jgi:nitronate monooxygenase